METAQESKLNMHRAIEKWCDDNPTIVSSVPAFAKSTVLLKSKIAAIDATVRQEKLAISGITSDKGLAKKALCRFAADTAASIHAYASTTNNAILKGQSNYSYSNLFNIKDEELSPIIQGIHDIGKANLTALTSSGISATVLDVFQTVITNYKLKVYNPKDATSIKNTIHLQIKEQLKDAGLVLKELDKTLPAFAISHPAFVASYKTNRIVIDQNKMSARLKGQIRSYVDGSIIEGAVISLDNTLFAAISNSKGHYSLKEIPFGTYTIIVTAPSYCDMSQTHVTVKLGQVTFLDFKMTPMEVIEQVETEVE